MKQLKNALKEVDQMQLMFINLAQEVHHIRAIVNYEIARPPFDGYTYIWNWNGSSVFDKGVSGLKSDT